VYSRPLTFLDPSSPSSPLLYTLQVDFERRKEGDVYNGCLMTINGTDFRIPQTGAAITGNAFGSHKYAGKSALRHEIGVSILRGDLVWINGPYPAGAWTDIKTFNKVIRHFLEPGEHVEANSGYVGAADKIKCPNDPCNPVADKGMQSRVRYRHEMINERCKTWQILKNTYRHNLLHHGKEFRAIAIITQIGIENGEPLFQAEYEDYQP
jgi:hypothetical protein